MSKRGRITFVVNVMFVHFATYILCGLVFMNLIDYNELFNMDGVGSFMKGLQNQSVVFGPLVQLLRGLLLGVVLFPFREVYISKKQGWLYLWGLLVIIGVISTYGASPSSIEGVIYTKLPLEFHLKMLPELLTQTFLFSLLVSGKLKFKIPEQHRKPVIATIIYWIALSLSGVILTFIIDVDIADASSDIGAYIVMIVAIIGIYFLSRYYFTGKVKCWIYYLSCYVLIAILPTAYNYLTNSVLKTPLSLIVMALPIVLIWLFDRLNNKE